MKRNCPKCGERVPTTALICPRCHQDIRNWAQKHPMWSGVIGLLIGLVLIMIFHGKSGGNGQPTKQDAKAKYSYSFEDGGVVENYYVNLDTNSLDGQSATEAAKSAITEMAKSCFKKCNISVYDDADAYNLDKTYMKDPPTSKEGLEAWDKDNYVFVADHLVAYKNFDTTEVVLYPNRDWRYQQLKAGN